jgi:hypothetical protein
MVLTLLTALDEDLLQNRQLYHVHVSLCCVCKKLNELSLSSFSRKALMDLMWFQRHIRMKIIHSTMHIMYENLFLGEKMISVLLYLESIERKLFSIPLECGQDVVMKTNLPDHLSRLVYKSVLIHKPISEHITHVDHTCQRGENSSVESLIFVLKGGFVRACTLVTLRSSRLVPVSVTDRIRRTCQSSGIRVELFP